MPICRDRQQVTIISFMKTLYLTHPACRLHEMGDWHPESPARLDAIERALQGAGVLRELDVRQAPAAPLAAIERAHHPDYIADLGRHSPRQGYYSLDPDTSMNPHTLEAALRAAGAALAAVDAVMAGEAASAFCAVRPPGHHACPDRAMGFCFFNNVAVAAHHAMARHGVERLAIVDFDVHHGNGTQAAFEGDHRVLMCGFFQHPFYPHSGAGPAADNMVNLPVPARTAGPAIRDLVTRQWLPRLQAHRPQLVLVSAGFDAHRDDDLGGLALVEDDYAWLTRQIVDVAARHAAGRIVSTLEGGYNLRALGRAALAHVRTLAKL